MVIRVSKVRTRWMFIVPTILISPNPKEEERKGIILKKVFVLLISRRSASSPVPPIRILY